MKTQFYTIEFFLSFTRFFLWTLINIPYYFFLSPVIICRIMNANNNKKKNSKFEKEAKSYENPILHHRIAFFSFTRCFLWTLRSIPYYFFFIPVNSTFLRECFFSLGFYFAWFLFSRVQNASYFRENPIFCSALFFAWFLFSRV